uniref:Vacuolar protein sorting-associated protein 51 homolog n=1 Tax=Plectus sambesii TaxID=2011161 RepID=A0A914X9U5_9BILA
MASSSGTGKAAAGDVQEGAERSNRPPVTEKDAHNHPLNLDAADFDCETYLSHLIKKKSLQKLLEVEDTMVQEVRRLDSDMQQLVYENYNKFITATDTVRKMRTDLAAMEQKMDALADNMQRISTLSEQVGSALGGQRNNVCKLARAHRTLKSLEFLFDLPKKLQSLVERKEFGPAVRAYSGARVVLDKYKSVPSLIGINAECVSAMDEVRDQLKERLRSRIISTEQVAEAVALLGQLDEPRDTLADELLHSAHIHLSAELDELEDQIRLKSGETSVPERKVHRPSDTIPNLPMDVLEFVDAGCSSFFGNLSVVGGVYTQLFMRCEDVQKHNRRLAEFVDGMMKRCFELAERRFMLENDPSESGMIVRALDRFYRRLTATAKIFSGIDYTDTSVSIVLRVAEHQVKLSYDRLVASLDARIKDGRTQLATGHRPGLLTPGNDPSAAYQLLSELLTKLEQSLLHDLKTALANMLQFTAYDVTYAGVDESLFARPFGRLVREKVVVALFDRVVLLGDEFCQGLGDKAYVNATLILLLSRFCRNLEASSAGYMLDLCEQQFRIGAGSSGRERSAASDSLTPSANVTGRLGAVAQRLLNHYVEMEGFALSQLLVKSVETRDWMGCAEPRAVRAVMKRVVEDLTAMDARVGQLFEEGSRKDRSSDSSRRTAGLYSVHSQRTARMPTMPLAGESAISSTLGKLWTERIDYFASVEFNKVSVLTGVVKICLKTLLESVRLRTFGKYGLQQVQVDCHYLQLYLWRFVFDEHLVHCLLDEVVSSAVHRCIDPQVMEPSVVELICDRG